MRKAEHMRILVAFGALSQVGGEASEDSGANRSSILPRGNPREVDADVRIGDRHRQLGGPCRACADTPG